VGSFKNLPIRQHIHDDEIIEIHSDCNFGKPQYNNDSLVGQNQVQDQYIDMKIEDMHEYLKVR